MTEAANIPKDLREAHARIVGLIARKVTLPWFNNEQQLELIERIGKAEAECKALLAHEKEMSEAGVACWADNDRLEKENKALWGQVEQFRYGDNYIKQFLDAKDKCAAMYPPEEVYTKGRLELWAEENGYALIASRAEEKHV
jgi:hypothetical protein